jgi:hypothetical protein
VVVNGAYAQDCRAWSFSTLWNDCSTSKLSKVAHFWKPPETWNSLEMWVSSVGCSLVYYISFCFKK